MLRVFAQDRRGERLLDEVAFRWRFIGPIHMIGGPDLAKTNLDLDELLLFLRRRPYRIFVTDQPSLQRRLAALDWEPDPDVRYRINESFCSDNMWQETVRELLDVSHAVLLDLRGFTAARRGTAFEIRLLAERDALKRTVILIDSQTDLRAVEQSLAGIPGGRIPQERVLRSDARIETNEIFTLLAEGAALPINLSCLLRSSFLERRFPSRETRPSLSRSSSARRVYSFRQSEGSRVYPLRHRHHLMQ